MAPGQVGRAAIVVAPRAYPGDVPDLETELVLRADDPRVEQVVADRWELVATSWGARLGVDPADDRAVARLRDLADRPPVRGYLVREIAPRDIPDLLALDARTAADYPGGVATHHEPLDQDAARALLDRGRAWGIWYADTLVAVTVTVLAGDRVETDFTAVHPDHRGRGLATAVKATSVLAHVEQGRTLFGTGGADTNRASLAMNRAVGYRITETWHTYRAPTPR